MGGVVVLEVPGWNLAVKITKGQKIIEVRFCRASPPEIVLFWSSTLSLIIKAAIRPFPKPVAQLT
jgi:hypothetical protein